MKKLIVGLIAVFALSLASAQNFGVYAGFSYPFSGSFGVVFNSNPVRYSAGIVFPFGVEGAVDYMIGTGPLGTAPGLNYYFGAGATLDAFFAAGGFFGDVFIHGLGGLQYQLSPQMALFGELQLGPAIGFGTAFGGFGSGFGFGFGSKVGLLFSQ
ncbi:MAG: hypothetical protein IVW51_04410 [Thermaceae bacterium]|nr:hypothetical protein [Thermaceae bacterium]